MDKQMKAIINYLISVAGLFASILMIHYSLYFIVVAFACAVSAWVFSGKMLA